MTLNKCIAIEDDIIYNGATALHIIKHQIYYYYVKFHELWTKNHNNVYGLEYCMVFDSPNSFCGVVFQKEDFTHYFEIIEE